MSLIEIVEWGLFILSPFLAVYTALWVYNAYAASRRREIIAERDARHERAFLLWWESVQAHHGLMPVFCPIKSFAGEACYFFVNHALLYEVCVPPMPKEHREDEEAADQGDERISHFDVECGVTVGRNWSVLDMFDNIRLLGPCRVCVMADRVCVRGGLNELDIPLDEITSVVASCSSLMVEAKSLDGPLLFGCINGQQLRDTMHILIDRTDDSTERLVRNEQLQTGKIWNSARL